MARHALAPRLHPQIRFCPIAMLTCRGDPWVVLACSVWATACPATTKRIRVFEIIGLVALRYLEAYSGLKRLTLIEDGIARFTRDFKIPVSPFVKLKALLKRAEFKRGLNCFVANIEIIRSTEPLEAPLAGLSLVLSSGGGFQPPTTGRKKLKQKDFF
jgi:hypothetical protein